MFKYNNIKLITHLYYYKFIFYNKKLLLTNTLILKRIEKNVYQVIFIFYFLPIIKYIY